MIGRAALGWDIPAGGNPDDPDEPDEPDEPDARLTSEKEDMRAEELAAKRALENDLKPN
jgi:hypothetical protein